MKRPRCCVCGKPADVAPLVATLDEIARSSYCFACADEHGVSYGRIPVEYGEPRRRGPTGRRAQREAAREPSSGDGAQLDLFGKGRRR